MGDFIKTEPSKVYAFDFPAAAEGVSQGDLTALAGDPGGSFVEMDEPDDAVTNIRPPMGQEIAMSAGDCALMCAMEVLGVKDILTAAGVASTPFPKTVARDVVGARIKGVGKASNFTNLPSVIAQKSKTLENLKVRKAIRTPVMIDKFPFVKFPKTKSVMRIFGRWIPGIG